jgi:hypothetical protein
LAAIWRKICLSIGTTPPHRFAEEINLKSRMSSRYNYGNSFCEGNINVGFETTLSSARGLRQQLECIRNCNFETAAAAA